MSTLYRKYRPQNFNEVVGQNHIKLTLEHEIASGKIAHAYLFCGPRAVGKTTMARVLAKAVNCVNRKAKDFEPCNKCESCNEITVGKSLDIMEIDAASHTGVDNVRENIIASARVAPVKAKYKVFIIDEVHMLSTSAFNALLKIMEEPPTFVMFILCTTEIHKVPTTIISRCQRFDFKKISISDIAKKLHYIVETEGVKVDKEILEAVARHSGGHMRDAESLLGQIVSISGKEVSKAEAELVIPRSDLLEAISLVDYLNKKDAANAIGLVNKLVDEGVDLKIFTDDFVEILRKMILAKVNPSLAEKLGLELGESLEIKINEISKNASLESLALFADSFIKARAELKNANIIQLPLELTIVNLCLDAGANQARIISANPQSRGIVNQISKKEGAVIVKTDNSASSGIAPIKHIQITNGQVDQNDIMAKWSEVLVKAKDYHHSLSFVLRVCEPRDLKGNQLCLAFKYKFHKDRISDPNIRALAEKLLTDTYGASLTIEAVIDETMEVADNSDNKQASGVASENKAAEETGGLPAQSGLPAQAGNMLDNLLNTFGGRVVG